MVETAVVCLCFSLLERKVAGGGYVSAIFFSFVLTLGKHGTIDWHHVILMLILCEWRIIFSDFCKIFSDVRFIYPE